MLWLIWIIYVVFNEKESFETGFLMEAFYLNNILTFN